MFDTIISYAQDQGTGASTFEVLFSIASIVGLWKMFEKAGTDGWPAIIPFYNLYKLCEVTMGNPWYWVRLAVFFIPIVGWIAGIYFLYQMCKATALAYGKPEGWAFGYLLLSGIFYCITGFDDSVYCGPMGSGDNRTASARGAKTVNFDVIENDDNPYKNNKYQDFSRQTRVDAAGSGSSAQAQQPKEDTVDFFFDQPEE